MPIPQYLILGKDDQGQPVRIQVTDSGTTDGAGRPIMLLGVDTELTVGDVTIGAVTLKDASAVTQATVKAPSVLGASDPALGVHDFTIGLTSDAVVVSDAAGTLSAKLRGLVKIFADVWNSTLHSLRFEGLGAAGVAAGGVLTVQGDAAGTPLPVSLAEDVELGAVKLLDAAGTNEAKIAVATTITEAHIALAVQAPVLGATTGAAVVTDANGTLQQYLRGIVKLLLNGLPASLGQKAMAASTSVVIASNQTAVPVSGSLGHSSQTVAPADQATTASYVDVTGSTIDSLANTLLSYTIINSGAASITWQVLAANRADFTDAVTVKAGVAVLAGASDTYTANPALYRYYVVQAKDTVGGVHGTASVVGIAKG